MYSSSPPTLQFNGTKGNWITGCLRRYNHFPNVIAFMHWMNKFIPGCFSVDICNRSGIIHDINKLLLGIAINCYYSNELLYRNFLRLSPTCVICLAPFQGCVEMNLFSYSSSYIAHGNIFKTMAT